MTSRLLFACTFLVSAALGLAACRRSEPIEIEVEVRGVGLDPASHSPVVLLQDRDRKLALPIWIGASEAQAIAMQLEGVAAPRPLTHDLMKSILDGAGVELQRVVITDLKNSTYVARIHLHAGRKDLDIDSRPSDAIALAVRFQRPIFVATALMKGEGTIDLAHGNTEGTATVAGVTVQTITAELADYFSLAPGQGVLVAAVAADTDAKLQRGDIILEVEGERVTGVGDFERKMRHIDGSAARLSVQRGSEQLKLSLAQPQ